MKKSINKLSIKLRDAIIKEVPTAESINYKGVTMSSKAPVWFQSFEKKNDERWDRQEAFNKNQEAFNKRIEAKVDKNTTNIELMLNTPTMKKELVK